jgi:mannose-1-phosphate guanylyltransferase
MRRSSAGPCLPSRKATSAHLIDRPRDEVMVSLHADQAVTDEDGWRAALAAAAARAVLGDIVTVGIKPTGPATGYGYVVASGDPVQHGGRSTFRVERFEEKPSPERAQELIASGRAYWNAGSFVWRRDTLLDGLARHAPDIDAPIAGWAARHAARSPAALGPWPAEAILEVYAGLPARAIDYALLEPASLAGRVAVVPADVGWSDLGTWSALREHRGTPGSAVVTSEPPASVLAIDSRDVLVHAAAGRAVALVGLDDVVVIDTPDALLVCSSAAAQDVKRVVDVLQQAGREDLL